MNILWLFVIILIFFILFLLFCSLFMEFEKVEEVIENIEEELIVGLVEDVLIVEEQVVFMFDMVIQFFKEGNGCFMCNDLIIWNYLE